MEVGDETKRNGMHCRIHGVGMRILRLGENEILTQGHKGKKDKT